MTSDDRNCTTRSVRIPVMRVRSVETQITALETYLNELRVIPATRMYRSRILLALLSKALTVGRAVCRLVDAGFAAEAFGLTRTLVDIYFTVRYLTNKEAESRTERFVEYSAKVQQAWAEVDSKYFPNRRVPLRSAREVSEIARKFTSKHQWTGERGQARHMAYEDDTFEVDKNKRPLKAELDYDATYFETSHFVHVTIIALKGHGSEHGVVFRVRAAIREEWNYADKALFNVVDLLLKIFIRACRAMGEPQPEAVLRRMYETIRRYNRRKRRTR